MKSLFLIAILLATNSSFAQTDELNLEKYWKLRDEFRESFVKIGPDAGESLPAGSIRPNDCIDTYDVVDDGTPFGVTQYGEMHWGDGTIRMGHYLSLLATEYRLLKDEGEDVTATINELYYAINALIRLDLRAEVEQSVFYYPSPLPEDFNGFYLREDIPEDFARDNWGTGSMNMRCTNSPHYKNNNAGKLNNDPLCPGCFTEGNSPQNTPSLDQMTSLLKGLRMVYELVDDVLVQPRPSDTPRHLKNMAWGLAYEMIDYVHDRNWFILDLNGWPVTTGGGDLAWTAYPLKQTLAQFENLSSALISPSVMQRKIGKYSENVQLGLTGFGLHEHGPVAQQNALNNMTYAESIVAFGIQNAQLCLPNSFNVPLTSDFMVWQTCGSDISTSLTQNWWQNFIPNNYPSLYSDWETDHTFDQSFNGFLGLQEFNGLNLTPYNNLIFFNLGVTSGLWSNEAVKNWADSFRNQELELTDYVLKGNWLSGVVPPLSPRVIFKSRLDSLSFYGPYNLEEIAAVTPGDPNTQYIIEHEYHDGGWAAGYRWQWPIGSYTGEREKGIYSGLDYMILHNLHYLAFRNQTNLPKFEERYHCECEGNLEKPIPPGATSAEIAAINGINDKLSYLSTCNSAFGEVNNDVSSTFTVGSYFPDYEELGIFPWKVQTANTIVESSGNLKIRTHLVICNNKELTIENGGVIDLELKDITVKSGAVVDLSGNLNLKGGTRIDLEEGSKLVLRAGSTLYLDDQSTLNIAEGAIVEYYDGALIKTNGHDNEIYISGNIVMKNGGIFSIDHSASGESGRVLINTSGQIFVAEQPCEIHLAGKGKTDEFIIVKDNSGLLVGNIQTNINKLTISDCKVELGENSIIAIYRPFITYQTNYESIVNNQGLWITNQNNFSNCDFIDVPIAAYQYLENTDKFHASNCKFWSKSDVNEQDRPLVYVNGMGFDIYSCEFKGSEHACLRSENLLHQSTIASSSFAHYDGYTPGTNMVGIHDVSNVEVKLLNNTIGQTKIGVSKVGGKLSLRCNTFAYNDQYHVLGAFGCRVNLSTDLGAGYNDFYAHPDVCISLNSAMISMNNGRNRFHDFQYYVKGDVISQCGANTDCAINASKNQWNIGNAYQLDPPLQSKFDVVGSDNLPFQFSANLTQLFPPCGYYDNGDPNEGTGQSGYPTAGTNDYIVNLPMISLSFNSNISLDDAVIYADRLSGLGQDVQAIEIYDEIFDLNLTKDDQTSTWLYRALSGMKSSLENAMFEENLLKEDNIVNFESHVQSYVDALNYMSDMSIQGDNYKEQFYLEIEKSHLYRMLEIDQMSNEVLSHIDVCGLDQEEQAMLNYWKTQYDIDLIVNQIGYAYLDSTIAVDTSGYNVPTSYTPPIFNFGSQINGVYNISYTSCASGNAKMNALANRPMNELSVHPNPADKFIDVQFDFEELEGEADIRITSLDGKEVIRLTHDFESKGNILSFDVSNWKQGGYLITARTATLGILQKQFVVTR